MRLFGPSRAESHESCKKRLDELEDRLGRLEAKALETYLEVMDKGEKIAAKLKDRERKREEVRQPERPPRPWELERGIQSR